MRNSFDALSPVSLVAMSLASAFVLVGCGRSSAADPSESPSSSAVAGQYPANSATIRVADKDDVRKAELKVSVYPAMKLADDNSSVPMTIGPSERRISPKFLCEDFSAQEDAVVPVSWEYHVGDKGVGALEGLRVVSGTETATEFNSGQLGLPEVEIVGLTGTCERLSKTEDELRISEPQLPSGVVEDSAAKLIVIKGFYGLETSDVRRSQILANMQLAVSPKLFGRFDSNGHWVGQVQGAPKENLLSPTTGDCEQMVVVPLVKGTTAPGLSEFKCPDLPLYR